MALLSMRKFAKATGISYYNIKKYIEDGIITLDENGMIDSKENLKILKKELKEGVKCFTVFFVLKACNPFVKTEIKRLMDKENAVEVKGYDNICLEYNRALQEKSVEVSADISKKYKEAVLEEFVKRYKACVQRQITVFYNNKEFSNISYSEVYDFLAFGKFPDGYEHLEGVDINNYIHQGIDRLLLKFNITMEEKTSKICEDLQLYWDSVDEMTVLTRSGMDTEFLNELKHSQLYRDILNNSHSFMIGKDLEHPTHIFENIKSGYKATFKSTVLSEYAKKRFYHIVEVHENMSHDECVKIICELRASDSVECFVCCAKDNVAKYIPESVLVYLDCMQRERKESVMYIDSAESQLGVSGSISDMPVTVSDSGVESSIVKKEPDSGVAQDNAVMEKKSVSKVEASNVNQKSVSKVEASNVEQEFISGVASLAEPVNPVLEQSSVEVIPVSDVEVVSKGDDAKDSINDLLSSLG